MRAEEKCSLRCGMSGCPRRSGKVCEQPRRSCLCITPGITCGHQVDIMRTWSNAISEPRRARRRDPRWTEAVTEPSEFEVRTRLFEAIVAIDAERHAAEVQHVARLDERARRHYLGGVLQARGQHAVRRLLGDLKKALTKGKSE